VALLHCVAFRGALRRLQFDNSEGQRNSQVCIWLPSYKVIATDDLGHSLRCLSTLATWGHSKWQDAPDHAQFYLGHLVSHVHIEICSAHLCSCTHVSQASDKPRVSQQCRPAAGPSMELLATPLAALTVVPPQLHCSGSCFLPTQIETYSFETSVTTWQTARYEPSLP
jgi:hypothetical protein